MLGLELRSNLFVRELTGSLLGRKLNGIHTWTLDGLLGHGLEDGLSGRESRRSLLGRGLVDSCILGRLLVGAHTLLSGARRLSVCCLVELVVLFVVRCPGESSLAFKVVVRLRHDDRQVILTTVTR